MLLLKSLILNSKSFSLHSDLHLLLFLVAQLLLTSLFKLYQHPLLLLQLELGSLQHLILLLVYFNLPLSLVDLALKTLVCQLDSLDVFLLALANLVLPVRVFTIQLSDRSLLCFLELSLRSE